MRVPLQWLREYVDPSLDTHAFADRLTMTGTKVEAIHHHGVGALDHFVVGRVLENRRPELAALERDVSKLQAIQAPFPRMSYDEAVEILKKKGSEIQWAGDFGNTDETLLTQDYDRPVIVDITLVPRVMLHAGGRRLPGGR